MEKDSPLFILAGNGPYGNRGCEAIIRGTVKILRSQYQDPSFLCISALQPSEWELQRRNEEDPAIIHKKINLIPHRFGYEWWLQRIFYRYSAKMRRSRLFNDMVPYLEDALAVLSVGGDNYSLDYGIPRLFTDLDDIVLEKSKPLFIWGASVGPFDTIPDYERSMIDHLKKITGIFARESATVDYLTKNSVTENVRQVADPAFLMDPVEPSEHGSPLVLDENGIGINLSPFMAKFVTGGDLSQWEQIAAKILSDIAQKNSRTIYLVPHVITPRSNDFIFLKNVWNLTNSQVRDKIKIIPPVYNAAETKWIISRLSLFAGARTHSTIAALSSNVPTLSFAYSIKAKGINRDIFGHEEYCLSPKQLTPQIVSAQIELMLVEKDSIQNELQKKIPGIQRNAMNAGDNLKDLLDNR
jgi:colanic acid/amylovoran biosynthesis protein